ncbi:MAG: hypothetical protein JXB29_06240 [Sedimentisphaerales bacterium]|nr:hypothetical protein [Sedimentisphaerales bacterium]
MTAVAIGTNDGVSVTSTHFGMSRNYIIYYIENGTVKEKRTVTNPYADPEKHKHAETDDIMSVLKGVNVCIGRKMGRKSPPIICRYGRVPLLTKAKEVNQCFDAFLQSKSDLFEWFSLEENKWVSIDPAVLQSLAKTADNEETV